MPPSFGIPGSPEALLAILALIPLLIAWFLGLFGSRPEPSVRFAIGNPLAEHLTHEAQHLVTDPIIHVARTSRSDELRTLALGLRHMPVEKAAPLLRHFMGSQDPELSLFSQSTLQQGREKLQTLFNQLRTHTEPHDPRIAASFLETGLRLASPSLMTPDERTSHLKHLSRRAHEYITSSPPTPRLVTACIRVFLAIGDHDHALALLQKLPNDSELQRSLNLPVQMAVHSSRITRDLPNSPSHARNLPRD
jgi:hypothetical protein